MSTVNDFVKYIMNECVCIVVSKLYEANKKKIKLNNK